MRRKLLIFHPALAPYRVDFFNHLNAHFDLVVYFMYDNVEDQPFDQERLKQAALFKVRYLTSGIQIRQRAVRLGMKTALKQEKPDIVISYEYSMSTLVSFLYRKISQRKYDLYTMCDDSLDKAKKRTGLRKYLRDRLSSNIDGVILHSEVVIDWYKKNVSDKIKYLTVPIIHDEKKIRQELVDSLDYANSYIRDYHLEGHKIVLFAGRLVALKNIPVLIDAFEKLYDESALLVIVGSGDLASELRSFVEKKGMSRKIIFTGRKEYKELYAWYMISHVLVFPSIHESYGVVVNEALICGCDVLCSDLAGAADLITESNGCVFNPYDRLELTALLQKNLSRQQVIPSRIANVRDNKMPFLFDQVIGDFVNAL